MGTRSPLDRRGLAQRAAPFLAAVVLGFAVAPLPPPEEDYVELAAAGLLTVALVLAGVVVPWGRLPRSAAIVVPLAFLPIVALLRESQGGASSGYATLALLPVFWVALYGSRRDVGIVVAALAVTFVMPIVALGEPNYPDSEWRRAILWAFVSGFVGLAVYGLVGRERAAAHATRRRAEELRQSEERFRQAFDHAPVGVALVGVGPADGRRILQVNAALARITGLTVDELRATSIGTLVHPDDSAAERRRFAELMAGELPSYELDLRLLRGGGRVLWVTLMTALVRDAAGEPLHVVVEVLDITERRRFEGQIQYLGDHDALTGLFNRRRFEEEIARQLRQSGQYGRTGAVLSLDLDHFHTVNDGRGRAVGDTVLVGSRSCCASARGRPTFSGGPVGTSSRSCWRRPASISPSGSPAPSPVRCARSWCTTVSSRCR